MEQGADARAALTASSAPHSTGSSAWPNLELLYFGVEHNKFSGTLIRRKTLREF